MNNFISINIIYIRKTNHLSQVELGEKIGATSHSISAYERNKALPGIDMIQKLCSEYVIKIDDFVNKDLSGIKASDDLVKEPEKPYLLIDRKTESMYERIVENYQDQLLLKDQLITEKNKTAEVFERTIKALEKEVIMQEVIINQNAINTNTPLTDRIAGILKLEAEIEASKKQKQS